MSNVDWYESINRYRDRAQEYGKLKSEAAQEFVRLVAIKTDRWVAQKMVDAEYAEKLEVAQAETEIAKVAMGNFIAAAFKKLKEEI